MLTPVQKLTWRDNNAQVVPSLLVIKKKKNKYKNQRIADKQNCQLFFKQKKIFSITNK